MRNVVTTLAAMAILVLASACAGIKARETVLMPAMKVAWISVSKDVERGILESLEIEDIDAVDASGLRSEIIAMDVALESGDPMRVADVNWHRLNQIAKIGIEARYDQGEIGLGVRSLLLKRLARFHTAYVKLLVAI